jgi:xanthine dehydrogenase YagS FAD-binding subunit
LHGTPPARGFFARAPEAELSAARPLRDNGYKVALARNVLVRTLEELSA